MIPQALCHNLRKILGDGPMLCPHRIPSLIQKAFTAKGGADLEPFCVFTEKNGVVLDTQLGSGGMPEGYGDAPKNPFCGETAHFIDVICGDAELIATPEQGIQMMQMLDAIYASSESGKGIALD